MNAQPMKDEALLAEFAIILQRRSGLVFGGSNLVDLQNGIRATTGVLGLHSAQHLLQVLASDSSASKNAFEQLVRAVTIGETYFFRYPEQFTVLREDVLPDLISRKRQSGDLSLRMWSAGCSSGEEPYSLCLTLMRLLPDPDAWRISILATDINRDSLTRAARAEYGPWSFRGVDAHLRQSYFKETETSGSNPIYTFHPEVRKRIDSWVKFDYLNLKDHCYPSLLTQTTAMDFIFCRNVLIYFSHEVAADVVENFHSCLSYGGYLMVGPVEPNERTFRDYYSLFSKGTMVYQRAETRPQPPVLRPHAKQPQRPSGAPRLLVTLPPTSAAAAFEQGTAAQKEGRLADARDLFIRARQADDSAPEPLYRLSVLAADRGEHEEALSLCLQAIERNQMDTRYYQLAAIVEAERGNAEAAVQFLRKAVFLDRDFVMGHLG